MVYSGRSCIDGGNCNWEACWPNPLETLRKPRTMSTHWRCNLTRAGWKPLLIACSAPIFANKLADASELTDRYKSAKTVVTGAATVCTRIRRTPLLVVYKRAACTQI